MNNEQFRKSITEVINKSQSRAVADLQKAEKALKENPRSHKCKEDRIGALRTLQAYQHLWFHITNGNFDSVEYYEKYIDPMSEHQKELEKLYK